MTIKVKKTIPPSYWYTGEGVTEITIYGVERLDLDTKKELTPIKKPTGPSQWAEGSVHYNDRARNHVIDLKRVEDNMKLQGWIEDDDNESAWNKYWKLRGMCVHGGPAELTLQDKEFNESTQYVYLEEVMGRMSPTTETALDEQTKDPDDNVIVNSARINVELTFYLADPI